MRGVGCADTQQRARLAWDLGLAARRCGRGTVVNEESVCDSQGAVGFGEPAWEAGRGPRSCRTVWLGLRGGDGCCVSCPRQVARAVRRGESVLVRPLALLQVCSRVLSNFPRGPSLEPGRENAHSRERSAEVGVFGAPRTACLSGSAWVRRCLGRPHSPPK